jgi:hypothetical protein
VTTRAPGQLSSGDDLKLLILHQSLPRFPEKSRSFQISQRHRTIIHHGHGISAFIASGTVFRTSLKNLPSRIVFFIFFLYLSFVFIASVLLGFGEFGLLFLSGKQLFNGRSHNSLSSLDFSFIYHNTTWLDPGRAFSLMHLQPGRDFDLQAACTLTHFHFFLFSLFIFIASVFMGQRQRETRSNAPCNLLGQVRDRSSFFSFLHSRFPCSFTFPSFLS